MMTVTVKVTKRQVLGAMAIFLLAFAVGVWGKAAMSRLSGENMDEAVPAATDITIFKANAKTSQQRLELLQALGWDVEAEETEILEIRIPDTFDQVLQNYNMVQTKQGCDLLRYRGKTCTRFTYMVTNHPKDSEYVRANLLVYKDKVIGGDVSSMRRDGFMCTLQGEEVTFDEDA